MSFWLQYTLFHSKQWTRNIIFIMLKSEYFFQMETLDFNNFGQ